MDILVMTRAAAAYIAWRVKIEGIRLAAFIKDGKVRTVNARLDRFAKIATSHPETVVGVYGPGVTRQMVQEDLDALGDITKLGMV